MHYSTSNLTFVNINIIYVILLQYAIILLHGGELMFTIKKEYNSGIQLITLDGCDDMNNYRLGMRRNCLTNDMLIWWDSYSTCMTITIDQENYPIYKAFKDTLDDVAAGEIFKEQGIPFAISAAQLNESQKPHQSQLYDPQNKTLTWVSDDTHEDSANRLIMGYDDEENITLEFIEKKPDSDIIVELKGEGSRYHECCLPFVRLFEELGKYFDDCNRQITMDEHINQLKLTKNKKPE